MQLDLYLRGRFSVLTAARISKKVRERQESGNRQRCISGVHAVEPIEQVVARAHLCVSQCEMAANWLRSRPPVTLGIAIAIGVFAACHRHHCRSD